METDTYPLVPGWAEKLAALSTWPVTEEGSAHKALDVYGNGRRGHSKPWVRGGLSICLSAADAGVIPEHINGNALYTLVPSTFYEHLQSELYARMHTWAFDVLIGYWLRSAHPDRLVPSEHIVSISSFQRSRLCCELVREIVAAATDGSAGFAAGLVRIPSKPHALLLHTGNIGKMPDTTVHPAMRQLGASMQKLFVAQWDIPCATLLAGEHSTLPQNLRVFYAPVAPWRVPLKAVSGSCTAPRAAPSALWWTPDPWRTDSGSRGDQPFEIGSILGCNAIIATRRPLGDKRFHRKLSADGGFTSDMARCVESRHLFDLVQLVSGAQMGHSHAADGAGAKDSKVNGGDGSGAVGVRNAVLVMALQSPDDFAWDAYLAHKFPDLVDAVRRADASHKLDHEQEDVVVARGAEEARAAMAALDSEARREADLEIKGLLSASEIAGRVNWVKALGHDPLVCALSSDKRIDDTSGASRPSLLLGGEDVLRDGDSNCTTLSVEDLQIAVTVLRERFLVIPFGAHLASAVKTISTYFGGLNASLNSQFSPRARLLLANRSRSAFGVTVPPPQWLRKAVLYKRGSVVSSKGGPGQAVDGAHLPTNRGDGTGSMFLDSVLYEEAVRLAAEQYRSIVWDPPALDDICSVADAAGAAREMPLPEPLALNTRLSFEFEGDGSRFFELVLPPPQTRSLTLLVKVKNVLGSSDISINLFVSHIARAPSFSEHEFRYVFDSSPPHHTSGARFTLKSGRLHSCCVEAIKNARNHAIKGFGISTKTSAAEDAQHGRMVRSSIRHLDPEAECTSQDGWPLILWVNIKYRAATRSYLELYAVPKASRQASVT